MDLSAVMNDDDDAATTPRARDADLAAIGSAEASRRKYEELQTVYAAAEQSREELSARYAALTARLDRISTENEYLLSELSYYEPSDLESDQSDIELVTARPRATPASKPAASRAKRGVSAAAQRPKPKPKAKAKAKAKAKQPAVATEGQSEETVPASEEPATKRKRSAPSGPKAKKLPVKKTPVKLED